MMIDFSTLPLFLTTVLLLALSPGPDFLLISTYASSRGFLSGLEVSAGILLAGILQTLLVAFGLGELMQSVPLFAYTIKFIGALYLCYLGLNMLLVWHSTRRLTAKTEVVDRYSNSRNLCLKGLFNNLLNPKALLFFSLFLPQFTTGTTALSVQILILGVILSCVVFIINVVFSFIFSKLGLYIKGKINISRNIDGLLGLVFLGLAYKLVTDD